MTQGSEAQLISEFRELLARDELTGDVTVVYGVSGGIPGTAGGGGAGNLKLAGDGSLEAPGEPAVRLDPSETRQLLQEVASSLDTMVTRAEARFLPDSTVGWVKIGLRGNEATMYFLADEEQRHGQDARIARSAMVANRPLRQMVGRARGEGGRGR
jgi:hypothetical protein